MLILGPCNDYVKIDPIYNIHKSHDWHKATSWDNKVKVLRSIIDIGAGTKIAVLHAPGVPDLVVVNAGVTGMGDCYWRTDWGVAVEDVEPFVSVEVLSQAYHKEVEIPDHNSYSYSYNRANHTKRVIDGYDERGYAYANAYNSEHAFQIPYNYLKVRVSMLDGSGSSILELKFRRPSTGDIDLSQSVGLTLSVTRNFFGMHLSWNVFIQNFQDFKRVLTTFNIKEGTDVLWTRWLSERVYYWNIRDTASVKAIELRKDIKPNLDRLVKDEPLLSQFFSFLHNGKTVEKICNNKLLCAFLERVGTDYDKLKGALRTALDSVPNTETISEGSYYKTPASRNIVLSLEGAQDKVSEGKAKLQWQFAKGAKKQAEIIGVSESKHPLLMAAIEKGDIPLSLFHEVGKEDQLVNVEFSLWEKALERKGWSEILVKIAQNASKRSTYSKRVTSYLAFLFRIEQCLDRNAPRKAVNKKKVVGWRAMPKFVESQWELEMDETTEEGTTKKRSALTPVADNETGIIMVPYVAMRVSGVRTTWCYAERYFVAEEGAEDPEFSAGGVFESDFEAKLNGRDDYGLCLFTLTGTAQNTGYPTFLIIFERTTAHGTKVHFHRVHPCRKRGPNGTQTPPNRLIAECYRYMAGNVKAEDIAYQQGDLLLVKAEGPGKSVDDPKGLIVEGFENHSFVGISRDGVTEPVRIVRSLAKERGNVLGWLHAPTGMRMPHPEHEPIENIPPGWYCLSRCKSYENNPVSVRVLSID